MDIEDAIVAHLLADEGFTSTIGCNESSKYRIYNLFPLALPQEDSANYPNGVTPGVVYQRISSPRTLSLTGDSANSPRFQFSVYARSLAEAREIAQALNKSLDLFIGTLGGKAKAQVIRADYRDSYEHETGLYRSDVDLFIYYNKKG